MQVLWSTVEDWSKNACFMVLKAQGLMRKESQEDDDLLLVGNIKKRKKKIKKKEEKKDKRSRVYNRQNYYRLCRVYNGFAYYRPWQNHEKKI